MFFQDLKQISFITPIESNDFNCLDVTQFKGMDVGYHGTQLDSLSSILTGGLKSAHELGNTSGLKSVSFSRTSNSAFQYAKEKFHLGKRVVLVVDLNSINETTIIHEGDVFYIYDPNPKPKVIAYCIEN